MNLLALLFGKKVQKSRLNYDALRLVEEKWPFIEQELKLAKPSNLKQAVIDADKVTDFVLKQLYPERETMGERLKLAKEKFFNYRNEYNDLWYAHKIRNELVHNPRFNLPSVEVSSIIAKFARGLEILGAKR